MIELARDAIIRRLVQGGALLGETDEKENIV